MALTLGLAVLFVALAIWSTLGNVAVLPARVGLMWGGFAVGVTGLLVVLRDVHRRNGMVHALLCLMLPFRIIFEAMEYKSARRGFRLAVLGLAAFVAAILLPFPMQPPQAAPPANRAAQQANRPAVRIAEKPSDVEKAKRLLNEQVVIMKQLTQLLKSVKNVASARTVAGQVAALHRKLRENEEILRNGSFLITDADEVVLDKITEGEVAAASAAYEQQSRIVAQIPGVLDVLKRGEPDRTKPIKQSTPVEPLKAADAGTSPAMPAVTPPLPEQTPKLVPGEPVAIGIPEGCVRLRITKIPNRDASGMVQDRLRALCDTPDSQILAGWVPDKQYLDVYLLRPVMDADAFEKKIDFGKVTRREGRLIEVEAKLPTMPGDLPSRSDRLTVALDDLGRPSFTRRREGAEALLMLPVQQKNRDEATRKLLPLLKAPDSQTRRVAVSALGVWGNREAVAALIAQLNDPDLFIRAEVIHRLGKTQDERAARPLAQLLGQAPLSGQAFTALSELGPIAELEVFALLESPETLTRMFAFSLLKTIASPRLIPKLERYGLDHKGADQAADRESAAKIIEAIRSRAVAKSNP